MTGCFGESGYLIHDRDPLFTQSFLSTLQDIGVQSIRLPPHSPNLNAYAERFVRSIRESCLDRLILFGESSLRTAIQNFEMHYHRERNHQGLDNRLIEPEPSLKQTSQTGCVQRRKGLGGMLNYYYRAAAWCEARNWSPSPKLEFSDYTPFELSRPEKLHFIGVFSLGA